MTVSDRQEPEEVVWFRDGARWEPSPQWSAIYLAIEEHASQPCHAYTVTERVLNIEGIALADRIEASLRAAFSPGHTDLMAAPESLDAWLAINPLPDESAR